MSNVYVGGLGVLSLTPRGDLGHPNSFLERVTKYLLNHEFCCTATRVDQHCSPAIQEQIHGSGFREARESILQVVM